MRLCASCIDNILRSAESWELHRCYNCLEQGAKRKRNVSPGSTKHEASGQGREEDPCLFCSALCEDIDRKAPHLEEYTGPIHRWSIRSLSRIRESLETVVLTFYPLPDLASNLPVRTFYLFPEDALGPWPLPAELGKSTNPAKNGGSQIQAWLTDCEESHVKCKSLRKERPPSSREVPTRLLDISGPSRSNMRVVETRRTPVRGPYATLSHCWGRDAKFVSLLPNNTKEFIEGDGVPWQLLTKNFREAIEVARFLGIEYMWIDSLCIIQGKDGDFKEEGAKMHSVYRNSFVNIAVADAKDSEGGLFRDQRYPGDVVPVRYDPSDRQNESGMLGDKPWRIVSSNVYESELLETSLYRRGWVFQGEIYRASAVTRMLTFNQSVCSRHEACTLRTDKFFGIALH